MTLTLSVNQLVLTWATTIENIAEFHLLVANTTDQTTNDPVRYFITNTQRTYRATVAPPTFGTSHL